MPLAQRFTRTGAWTAIAISLWSYWDWLLRDRNWLIALPQMLLWLLHPVVRGMWPVVPGWPVALLGTIFLMIVGALISLALLPEGEFDQSLGKLLAYSALLGFASAGWGAQVFAALSVLYSTVEVGWLVTVGLAAALVAQRRLGPLRPAICRIVAPARAPRLPRWQIILDAWIFIAVALIVLLAGFHAFAFPIVELDALTYHAGLAKFWFLHRPTAPLIAGPSQGVALSSNWPALFPGVGTFYYLLTGGVHDVYVRLLPPVLGVATLSLAYHAARRSAGIQAGWFTLAMLSATPLFFHYAVWPAAYDFLMLLMIALLDCLVGAWETGKTGYILGAGVLAGLIGDVTYLSALVYVYLAGCTFIYALRRRVRLGETLLPAALLLLIAAPPYLRNWINLGDPVFPFANGMFHSPYIPDPSVLRDSVAQGKHNALGYWDTAGNLLAAQIHTLLSEKMLVPTGTLVAALGVLLVPAGSRAAAAVHLSWILYFGTTQLVQGWFWVRYLTPMVPSLAVLTGVTFARCAEALNDHEQRFSLRGKIAGFIGRTALSALVAAVFVFPGLTLAWAGPNMRAETPYLWPDTDYGAAWRYVGNSEGWLRYVLAGDYEAWQWLNAHLTRGDRVATLENRWYYLGDPSVFFPLDGITPLLSMDRAPEIARYLREHNVRYILATPWFERGRGTHPILKRLALYRYLGSPSFPLRARFEIFGDYVTRIYGVEPEGCSSVPGDCSR